VPRRINLLCDRALLGGYASGLAQVTPAIVRRAAAEVFDTRPPTPAPRRGAAASGLGLVVLAAVLAGAGLTWGLQQASQPGRAAKAGTDAMTAAAAAAALAPASATAATPPPSAASAPRPAASAASSVEPKPEPLHLADWAPRDADAWAALAQRWSLPPRAEGDLCTVAPQQGLQCHRSTMGSLSLIRLIDRPVLLTLRRLNQPPALAALVGLDGQHATLLVDGVPRRVPLPELASTWRGEFTTLWRMPPGYAIRADNSGPLRAWVAGQLGPNPTAVGPISSRPSTAPSWAELSPQVQAFQAGEGLQPDGRIGPITLMLINRAAGVNEPRLDAAR
jgi:general secretion pathway protein A